MLSRQWVEVLNVRRGPRVLEQKPGPQGITGGSHKAALWNGKGRSQILPSCTERFPPSLQGTTKGRQMAVSLLQTRAASRREWGQDKEARVRSVPRPPCRAAELLTSFKGLLGYCTSQTF